MATLPLWRTQTTVVECQRLDSVTVKTLSQAWPALRLRPSALRLTDPGIGSASLLGQRLDRRLDDLILAARRRRREIRGEDIRRDAVPFVGLPVRVFECTAGDPELRAIREGLCRSAAGSHAGRRLPDNRPDLVPAKLDGQGLALARGARVDQERRRQRLVLGRNETASLARDGVIVAAGPAAQKEARQEIGIVAAAVAAQVQKQAFDRAPLGELLAGLRHFLTVEEEIHDGEGRLRREAPQVNVAVTPPVLAHDACALPYQCVAWLLERTGQCHRPHALPRRRVGHAHDRSHRPLEDEKEVAEIDALLSIGFPFDGEDSVARL